MAWAPFLFVVELAELIVAADLIADAANGAD
jgi:hypothetical protein